MKYRTCIVSTLLAIGAITVPEAIVAAQTNPPPTTVEVKGSTVQRPVTTTETHDLETDDDDDSNVGLWGLLGLLGLVGLAGLAKRKKVEHEVVVPPRPPRDPGLP